MVIKKFFGLERHEVDWNNIQFVYVIFKPRSSELHVTSGFWSPNYLGTFEWMAKGIGFGSVSMNRLSEFGKGAERILFDTEDMSKSFLKQLFAFFVEQSITDRDNPNNEVPEFDRQYKKVQRYKIIYEPANEPIIITAGSEEEALLQWKECRPQYEHELDIVNKTIDGTSITMEELSM